MAEYVLDVLSHSRKRAPIGHLVSFVFVFGRFEAPVILKRLLRRVECGSVTLLSLVLSIRVIFEILLETTA
jgi:hypothetical protein